MGLGQGCSLKTSYIIIIAKFFNGIITLLEDLWFEQNSLNLYFTYKKGTRPIYINHWP